MIREQTPQIPMVILTGHPDLAEQMKNSEFGGVVKLVIMKPVDTSTLVRFVHGERFCIRDFPPSGAPPRD